MPGIGPPSILKNMTDIMALAIWPISLIFISI